MKLLILGLLALCIQGNYAASTLQHLVDMMWAADNDKPTNNKIDWGNPVSGTRDESPNKLFTYVDESLFERAQYKALIKMYDANLFHPEVCTKEPAMSGSRKTIITEAFDAFVATPMFQLAIQYLQEKGVISDFTSFRPRLWTLWTGTYTRCKGTEGSSGWEHVFFGEWKGSTVDGQHDWVKYYLLEKAGQINYHGYKHHDEDLTGTFQYKWESYMKKVGGFNTGTSPAFDFSVFTVCALTEPGANKCKFTIEGYEISVTSYTQACTDGVCLSTSYPSDT